MRIKVRNLQGARSLAAQLRGLVKNSVFIGKMDFYTQQNCHGRDPYNCRDRYVVSQSRGNDSATRAGRRT